MNQHRTVWLSSLTAVITAFSVNATDIPVANGSFELPSTTFVDPRVDSWTKTPQPDWFDPSLTGGITWDQMTGVFANTASDQLNHINNLDGNQALFLIALPQVGLSQVLSAPDAKYQAGFSYQLTLGMLGGGNISEGTSLQLGLFYLDGANLPVSVGTTTVSYSSAVFPGINNLVDQSLVVPGLQAGDGAVGKSIGVSIVSLSGTGAGYWDLDHVRLSAAAVPEPGTLALFGLGLGGMAWSLRRPRNRG